MVYKRILLPVDGSEHSSAALHETIRLARSGGEVIVATVLPVIPEVITGEAYLKAREDVIRGGSLITESIVDALKAEGISCQEEILFADTPAEGIVDAVVRLKCDLVIMATRGQTELKGLILGSVTHRVLTLSPVPVLVVR